MIDTYLHNLVALAIAKAPSVTKYDLSSLRFWRCGAAPIGPATAAAVLERTGIPLCGGYGTFSDLCTKTHLHLHNQG